MRRSAVAAFLLGMGQLLDIGDTLSRHEDIPLPPPPREVPTDAEALESDWQAVANDFWSVLGRQGEEKSDG